MILVFGAEHQGKWTFCREVLLKGKTDYLDGRDCELDIHFPADQDSLVFNRLNAYLRRHLSAGPAVRAALSRLLDSAGRRQLIIIADDCGAGLVPVDPEERQYREELGRTLCYLAEEADTVYRVLAGRAIRLKG